jgi:hypothetical protein
MCHAIGAERARTRASCEDARISAWFSAISNNSGTARGEDAAARSRFGQLPNAAGAITKWIVRAMGR